MKVLKPIDVPIGIYCWDQKRASESAPESICEHFDNSDGVYECDLKLGDLYSEPSTDNVLKCKECLILEPQAERTEECTWFALGATEEELEEAVEYETTCGFSIQLRHDLSESEFTFCPHCGGRIANIHTPVVEVIEKESKITHNDCIMKKDAIYCNSPHGYYPEEGKVVVALFFNEPILVRYISGDLAVRLDTGVTIHFHTWCEDAIKSFIPKEKWGVHTSHCCIDHGCKYGDKDCPVELGLAKQEHPCEQCKE